MVIDDYDQVIGLWTNTEAMLLRDADSRENIGQYLHRNSGLSFVALEQDRIIGAVLVGTDGRRGYVQHLAVSETQRRNGTGQRLINHALAALSKQGIDKTHLFVANTNTRAQTFYEKNGWFVRDEVRMYSFNTSDNQNI